MSSLLDEFCQSDCFYESIICGQRMALDYGDSVTLFGLLGAADGLFLVAATSSHGHLCQSFAYLLSDPVLISVRYLQSGLLEKKFSSPWSMAVL